MVPKTTKENHEEGTGMHYLVSIVGNDKDKSGNTIGDTPRGDNEL